MLDYPPNITCFSSTSTIKTLKVGDPQAIAKYFPSNDSSMPKIYRGQILRI